MKFLAVFLLSISLSFAFPLVPDAFKTPGDFCKTTSSDFKEFRYAEKIPYCKRNVSSSDRRNIYYNYGIFWEDRKHFTIDHFIPLSLGGSNSYLNLWPEHKSLKQKRGSLEFHLYRAVFTGKMGIDEARWIIRYAKTNERDKRYCDDLERYRRLYRHRH